MPYAVSSKVLRQNRRVVADNSRRDEIENFHKVLFDASQGVASDIVKQFLVQAYVRGAQKNTADLIEFEGILGSFPCVVETSLAVSANNNYSGTTSVFAKRRYRDKWNKRIVTRISHRQHSHSLKVKARMRPRGPLQLHLLT